MVNTPNFIRSHLPMRIQNFSVPLLLVLLLVGTGCTKQLVFPTPVNSAMVGKIKKVVILGNSIVRAVPQPAIGWLGDWGMAASEKEKDFVHLLIRHIHSRDSSVMVKFKNIADFENAYGSFDLATIDSLRNADLIIMRIGENVRQDLPQPDVFLFAYDRLLHHLDGSGKAVKLITDGFWNHTRVNKTIRDYALQKGLPLVSITDMSAQKQNVGFIGHPTDAGMRIIEERIWAYVANYF